MSYEVPVYSTNGRPRPVYHEDGEGWPTRAILRCPSCRQYAAHSVKWRAFSCVRVACLLGCRRAWCVSCVPQSQVLHAPAILSALSQLGVNISAGIVRARSLRVAA